MSKAGSTIAGMIEQRLLNMHTAYFAKVLSVNGKYAKIQPLNKVKAIGGTAQKQAAITDVPVLDHVKDLAAGDTVFVMVADRDITDTKKGKLATPSRRHHDLSDSVIIGKF